MGLTVQVATLTQALAEIDPADRVLESVERQAQYVEVGGRDASSAAWQSRMAAGGAPLR